MVLELERADRMRDALQRVGDGVRVIVERIDAPLVAGAMVRRVADAVDGRIAHVQVRAAHVDLQPKDVRAVGKFARAHAAEEFEIFGDRPVAVRAVATGLRQRAARAAHFLGRLAVDIGESLFDEPLGESVQRIVVVGRVIAVSAPVVTQPPHRVRDGVLELDVLLERIGVVEAQVARAAVLGGESEIEDDRLGVPVMKVAIGLGRETGHDAAVVLAGSIVVGDDDAQEIGRERRPHPWARDAAAPERARLRPRCGPSNSFVAVQHSFRFVHEQYDADRTF